jgi:hypothetical protein
MQSIVIRSAAAALLAASLLPAAGFAQSGDRSAPTFNPYAGKGNAQTCTQLERAAGVSVGECGTLTLSEIAARKADRDNTN